MRYSFLEQKYNNKYKFFEYDQFDDEDDEEESIDQEKIDQMNELLGYVCSNIHYLFDKLFYEDNSLEEIEKYIKYNKRLLNEIYCGETPLTTACFKHNADIVKLLLKYGANPNIKDKYGDTALVKACFKADYELVKLLLEHGADPEIKNLTGNTPLYFMSTKKKNEQNYISNRIVELLLKYGNANPNTHDGQGFTALMNSIIYNNNKMVELLLKYGANPNIKETHGYTALDFAQESSNADIIDLLLKYGAKE